MDRTGKPDSGLSARFWTARYPHDRAAFDTISAAVLPQLASKFRELIHVITPTPVQISSSDCSEPRSGAENCSRGRQPSVACSASKAAEAATEC